MDNTIRNMKMSYDNQWIAAKRDSQAKINCSTTYSSAADQGQLFIIGVILLGILEDDD